MLSSKDYIRFVTFIYILALLIPIVLLITSIWEINPRREKQHDLYYLEAIGLIFILGPCLLYRLSIKYIKTGKGRRGLKEKLILYKKALYSQWGIIEFMSLSAIVAYIMTADNIFIFATIFCIILLILCRPSIKRTIEELELDDRDTRILETPDAAL